jgi:hypothetical protein
MKRFKIEVITLNLIAIFFTLGLWGQGYTGSYTLTTDKATLTLLLNQANDLKLYGKLSSNTGMDFSLEGEVSDGIGIGICSSREGSVFFELFEEDGTLVLGLIEADVNNMPDYEKASYLAFTKTSSVKPDLQEAFITEIPEEVQVLDTEISVPPGTNNPLIPEPEQQSLLANAIGDPSWGFSFVPPSGWTHQKTAEGFMMGHNSIPGLILVFPHMLENMQQVQQEMNKGIQEEGSYLTISGSVSKQADNIFAADYTGVMDGTQVKARGFGTLSPYGGGAFILAVSTPDKLGQEIITDASAIANGLIYTRSNASDLMQHFAGKWANFTKNTSTWIVFYADGTYDEQYESSYSGDLSGGGNWGTYGGSNAKGRWMVQGNRDNGRITVMLNNGNEIVYEYRVHEENGQKFYSEYWFNGSLYGKSRN